MESKRKPVFKLTEDKTPRRTKSRSELHRFLVRVLAPVNETMRQKAMYRGDLSDMVAQSLESVDLASVPLVAMKWGQEEFPRHDDSDSRQTRRQIGGGFQAAQRFDQHAHQHGIHWLAEQGDVTIKGKPSGKS